MFDSVPGPDAVTLSTTGGFNQSEIDRYKRVMSRLATGYTVSTQGTAATAPYSATTLKPSERTHHHGRRFREIRSRVEEAAPAAASRLRFRRAWNAPTGRDGRRLPHGLGWFVQNYNGVDVVWQFGSGNASSSMVVTVPSRGLTMILLANSSGLAKGFNLAAGDVNVSPFAKAFLGTFHPVGMMRLRPLLVGILFAASPASAAERQIQPFIAVSFAGATTFVDLEQAAGKPNVVFGARAILLGEIVGVEADVGHAPGFFQAGEYLVVHSRVTTLSGNIVVAVPRRLTEYTLRPFFVGGGGLMHAHIEDIFSALPVSDTLPAIDLGFGVSGFVTDKVGFSWDLRHFRSLGRKEDRRRKLWPTIVLLASQHGARIPVLT